MKNQNDTSQEKENQLRKMESLRETINAAEKTIQSAKAMLLQLEGKKKTGRKRKTESTDGERIVQGTFDGQIMIGEDGKHYPVPANYASKSKLVEGDMLKLTIPTDGAFIYKQIGPANRKNIIGIVSQDETGSYYILAEGRPYKVLLASITYFKVEPGDEVVIVVPTETESDWAAIENVISKGSSDSNELPGASIKLNRRDEIQEGNKEEEEKEAEATDEQEEESNEETVERASSVLDEWTADIEEIKREIERERVSKKEK